MENGLKITNKVCYGAPDNKIHKYFIILGDR